MVLARALSLIIQPTWQVEVKADGTDTSGLAVLLGKCHYKPTTNASDLSNYSVGNQHVSVHCSVCDCVGPGEAISNSSWNTAGCAADHEIAFH